MVKMSRIGKCKINGCDGEIGLLSYGDNYGRWDGLGMCPECLKEYPLEYKGRSNRLTLKL